MPTIADVILTSPNLPGQSVTVSTVMISMSPIVFEITASVAGSVFTERHAIGADGTGPLMTAATLQASLDAYRQSVADKAAWHASAAAAIPQLK